VAFLAFTPNLARHVQVPAGRWAGRTVAEVLREAFRLHPRARGYVLDDAGGLREHVTVFVNGHQITDRVHLAHPVSDDDEIYVMQALSGG